VPDLLDDEEVEALLRDFEISLEARRRSPRTIGSYLGTARLFARFVDGAGGEPHPGKVTKRDVEAFIAHQAATTSSSTAASRYRYLQQWFRWLAEEEIIEANPMAGTSPPAIEEKIVPVLSIEQLRALLASCSGKSFDDRRDEALVRFMVDTGARLGETAGLTLPTMDARARQAVVHGKGDRNRRVFFSPKTAEALSRYERQRRAHPRASTTDRYWIGSRGPLTDSGITQVLRRRALMAGISKLHPHMLRHTWAHLLKSSGMADDELMELGGWRTGQMLQRYGSSARAERARASFERMAPGSLL
jgi:site-specific recombinase XerD